MPGGITGPADNHRDWAMSTMTGEEERSQWHNDQDPPSPASWPTPRPGASKPCSTTPPPTTTPATTPPLPPPTPAPLAPPPPRLKQALLDDPRTDNDTGHHPTPPASQTPAQAQPPIAHSGQDIPVPASTTKPKSTAQISAAACPVRVKWDWGPVRQPGSAARVNSEAGRGHGRAVERHFGVRLAFQNSPPASRRPCRAWLYYPRAGLPARRITCAPVGYQQAARPSGRATPRRDSRTSYASA